MEVVHMGSAGGSQEEDSRQCTHPVVVILTVDLQVDVTSGHDALPLPGTSDLLVLE
jgi:hypothetical protein